MSAGRRARARAEAQAIAAWADDPGCECSRVICPHIEDRITEAVATFAATEAQEVHVTDVPLAAALLTQLKEECERQHALAEEAERERDEAREALHEKSEALETMLRLEFDHAPLCPIRTRRCDCKGTG